MGKTAMREQPERSVNEVDEFLRVLFETCIDTYFSLGGESRNGEIYELFRQAAANYVVQRTAADGIAMAEGARKVGRNPRSIKDNATKSGAYFKSKARFEVLQFLSSHCRSGFRRYELALELKQRAKNDCAALRLVDSGDPEMSLGAILDYWIDQGRVEAIEVAGDLVYTATKRLDGDRLVHNTVEGDLEASVDKLREVIVGWFESQCLRDPQLDEEWLSKPVDERGPRPIDGSMLFRLTYDIDSKHADAATLHKRIAKAINEVANPLEPKTDELNAGKPVSTQRATCTVSMRIYPSTNDGSEGE